MAQRKICMIGSFAVGKTSLVQHFVHQTFSDEYYTTVGVKIDRKVVELEDQSLQFILWDLNGEDAFQSVQMSYLRGMHGYFLVMDGTRMNTVETALRLDEKITEAFGEIPSIRIMNKHDLSLEWEVDEDTLQRLTPPGDLLFKTSASKGEGVEDMFTAMAKKVAS